MLLAKGLLFFNKKETSTKMNSTQEVRENKENIYKL